ncbi:MAG: hypothetical protein B6D55_06175 [Candidatus Omnitrophica bacterium 4484_70.2]|nr:MAG: hypothetical protein B6D55_06175 [Candidatus Omnitrophica bacterium 4484_70.2]
MSVEKEIKILEVEKSIYSKIFKIGGKLVKSGVITTIFLDFDDNKIREKGDILRLRIFKKEVELTYKKRKKSKKLKVAEEINVKVDNYKETLKILRNIGLKKILKIKKIRKLYKVSKNFEIAVDKIEGIPLYIELEGDEKKIFKFIKKLGLENKKVVDWDTFELLEYYGKL